MTRNMSRVDVDKAIAGVKAGHIMAGMPLTDTAESMLRRLGEGKTTVEQEVAAARNRAAARVQRRKSA